MRLTVLIVDDSAMVRAALRRALPRDIVGAVQEAEDGRAALDVCGRGLPDVIFLDLDMPVLDGYGVLNALRPLPHRPRVIVVSADVSPQTRQMLRSMGADEVLAKPWQPEEVRCALRTISIRSSTEHPS